MRKVLVLGFVVSMVGSMAGSAVSATTPPHCSGITDCAVWGNTNCIAPQVPVCAQPGTAQSHCACYTPPPSTQSPPHRVPGESCWQVYNDCTFDCESSPNPAQCQNNCSLSYGACS